MTLQGRDKDWVNSAEWAFNGLDVAFSYYVIVMRLVDFDLECAKGSRIDRAQLDEFVSYISLRCAVWTPVRLFLLLGVWEHDTRSY